MSLSTASGAEPGQPIPKATGELMMALYQARIKASVAENPDLGINIANEPQQVFFKVSNLSDLLAALNAGSGYVATCLGLTVLDANGKPIAPTAAQLTLMQELVDLQAAGDYTAYKAKIQTISLAQTVLIAGCDNAGNLNISDSGVYSFYDMAGGCCN